MKRKIYNSVLLRKGAIMLFALVFFSVCARAQWQIYNASVLPGDNNPVFITSGLAGAGMVTSLVADPLIPQNGLLELLTVAIADNGTWRRSFTDPTPNLTVAMRVRSANDNALRVLELDLDNGGFRERLYINQADNKLRLQHSTAFGATNEFNLPNNGSVKDWHIYRITKDGSGNVRLYIDENPAPLASGQTTTTSTNNYFRFGDTNGSHNISALIDWIIWDQSGVYAPGQGTPIPANLLINVPANWRMYDGSLLPGAQTPTFTTSNVAGNGGTNNIMTEPGVPTNKLLEVITIANADNFMWSTPLQTATTGVTILMRVKAANDVARRVLELDLNHNGIRERLYINRENNRIRLNEGIPGGDAGEIPAPVGVNLSDWNIYRLTKSGAITRIYLNETDTPIGQGTSTTTTTQQYFRIGDGNSSHNIAALIDWIIWDETGAYAPGQGSLVPSPVITPSWDATLSNLRAGGTPVANFNPDVTSYEVILPAGTTTPTVVIPTTSNQGATAKITQATTVPGTATVVVTAFNGFTTRTYTVAFIANPTGNITPDAHGFKIYPNPANTLINVQTLGEGTNGYIEILGMTGQLLFKKQMESQSETIDISKFARGMYLLKYTSEQHRTSRLLMKY